MSSKQSFSFEDINEGVEGRVTSEDSSFELKEDKKDRSEKPQVWIRIRPSPKIQDNIFDVTEEGKGVRLLPTSPNDPYNLRHRQTYREQREEHGFVFSCDGVLRNTSQEETYQLVAHDLVNKAMDGISGLILCVGPEISGKHFTLFGSTSKFQYRGIIPRCLERIFQICESRASEMRYLIRMAIIEIRHDKIRDLLTLGSFDGNSFDKDSPHHGMVFQKIGAPEHGFGLLIRALTCQKEIPREPFAKPHTVVFIDIYGESYVDVGGTPTGQVPINTRVVKSRITFAKTASIPERNQIFPNQSNSETVSSVDANGCCMQTSSLTDQQRIKYNNTSCSSYTGSTCNSMVCSKRKSGPVTEAIRIRQDIGYIEQMCSRACQYQKFTRYYEKFATLRMRMPEPPASQHFRLSKLTYCLKDIVSGNSEIRIILHIRPEKKYKHASLEAMRFAEKAKCVPYGMDPHPSVTFFPSRHDTKFKKKMEKPLNFGKELSISDFISKMPSEVSDLYIQVNPGTFKKLKEHASALFDGRIHAVTDTGESQVQELFQKFGNIWNYAMETGLIPTQIPPTSPYKLESTENLDKGLSRRRSKKRISLVNILPNHVGQTASSATVVNPEEIRATTKKSKTGKSKTNLKESTHSITGKKKKKSRKPTKTPSVITPKMSTAKIETEDKDTTKNITSKPSTPVTDKKHDSSRPVTPNKSKTAIEQFLGSGDEHNRILESREAPTKQEAWTTFLSTDNGQQIVNELTEKNKILEELAGENNGWIKDTSHILSNLNKAQMELSLIQQERYMKDDEYDADGNIIVPSKEKQLKKEIKNLETQRDELATKLKNIRGQLIAQKNIVEMEKTQVENAFQTFALVRQDNYATTYTDHLDMKELAKESLKNLENLNKDIDDERIRKFEDIKRVAKKQARYFLRALAKKPSWIAY